MSFGTSECVLTVSRRRHIQRPPRPSMARHETLARDCPANSGRSVSYRLKSRPRANTQCERISGQGYLRVGDTALLIQSLASSQWRPPARDLRRAWEGKFNDSHCLVRVPRRTHPQQRILKHNLPLLQSCRSQPEQRRCHSSKPAWADLAMTPAVTKAFPVAFHGPEQDSNDNFIAGHTLGVIQRLLCHRRLWRLSLRH